MFGNGLIVDFQWSHGAIDVDQLSFPTSQLSGDMVLLICFLAVAVLLNGPLYDGHVCKASGELAAERARLLRRIGLVEGTLVWQ